MLSWALVFLVIALIAGVLGFTGVAVASAGIAKVLFVIFLVLFLISVVTHLARGAFEIAWKGGPERIPFSPFHSGSGAVITAPMGLRDPLNQSSPSEHPTGQRSSHMIPSSEPRS